MQVRDHHGSAHRLSTFAAATRMGCYHGWEEHESEIPVHYFGGKRLSGRHKEPLQQNGEVNTVVDV